jgi:hypothetical protein
VHATIIDPLKNVDDFTSWHNKFIKIFGYPEEVVYNWEKPYDFSL